MSSDLFIFDDSFYQHSTPIPNDNFSFLSESLSTFSDPDFDIFQQFSDESQQSIHQISNSLLSSSPPSAQLQNLSLQTTTSTSGVVDFAALEVKAEECNLNFDSNNINSILMNGFNVGSCENVERVMQRSFSICSFDQKPSFLFQPRLGTLMESPKIQTQVISSPENNFSSGNMRRVCSTGDLQKMKMTQTRLSSSPLGTETSFMEEANFKVGRYSAEERKERIHRYRAKRTQRNFNKTIKYACRKTLADNRPRIRGRFARNDETGEIPKATCSARDEEEDELWIEGLNEEDYEGTEGGGKFLNNFDPSQFRQYYGF
ncbi:CCT domain [Dillenia turbinata]|uniref:CCT domain n=1 Tax=Dillenia turbinata TaxID=194707 RepID=A0AAN8W7X6_9MAGN